MGKRTARVTLIVTPEEKRMGQVLALRLGVSESSLWLGDSATRIRRFYEIDLQSRGDDGLPR